MSQKRRAPAEVARKKGGERRAPGYRRPELQRYGSLKELTRTLSTVTPGDGFGGSFAV